MSNYLLFMTNRHFIFLPLFLSSLVACICFMIGCQRSESEFEKNISTTVSNTDVHWCLKTNISSENIQVNCLDASYVVFTEKYVKNQLTFGFSEHLTYLGINTYVSELSDCDKFSQAFVEHSRMKIRKNSSANSAPVVGMVSYTTQTKSGSFYRHEINVLLAKNENNQFVVLFYEPQTKSFVKLTEFERSSISRVVF